MTSFKSFFEFRIHCASLLIYLSFGFSVQLCWCCHIVKSSFLKKWWCISFKGIFKAALFLCVLMIKEYYMSLICSGLVHFWCQMTLLKLKTKFYPRIFMMHQNNGFLFPCFDMGPVKYWFSLSVLGGHCNKVCLFRSCIDFEIFDCYYICVDVLMIILMM